MMLKRLSDVAMLLLGVLITLIAAPLILISVTTLQSLWDAANPPATMTIHTAKRAGDTLKMEFHVTRHRPCAFNGLTGFSGPNYSDMVPGVLRKEDGSEPRDYPVGITVTSPPWLMVPFVGPRVLLYGSYDCAGKPVTSLVIDDIVTP